MKAYLVQVSGHHGRRMNFQYVVVAETEGDAVVVTQHALPHGFFVDGVTGEAPDDVRKRLRLKPGEAVKL